MNPVNRNRGFISILKDPGYGTVKSKRHSGIFEALGDFEQRIDSDGKEPELTGDIREVCQTRAVLETGSINHYFMCGYVREYY